MQVVFKRWCLKEEEHGIPLSINPRDVVSTEFACPAYEPRWPGEKGMPEATRVILRKGKEYWVQGSVAEVTGRLNNVELTGGEDVG